MNQQQAIEILVQAARVANKRGAFELEEAEQISAAVKVFTTPPQSNQDLTDPTVEAVEE